MVDLGSQPYHHPSYVIVIFSTHIIVKKMFWVSYSHSECKPFELIGHVVREREGGGVSYTTISLNHPTQKPQKSM